MCSLVSVWTLSFMSSHNSFGVCSSSSVCSSSRNQFFTATLIWSGILSAANITSCWWEICSLCLEPELEFCDRQLVITSHPAPGLGFTFCSDDFYLLPLNHNVINLIPCSAVRTPSCPQPARVLSAFPITGLFATRNSSSLSPFTYLIPWSVNVTYLAGCFAYSYRSLQSLWSQSFLGILSIASFNNFIEALNVIDWCIWCRCIDSNDGYAYRVPFQSERNDSLVDGVMR